MKVIDKMKLDAATRVQMLQEVQLMKLVQHPHVVRAVIIGWAKKWSPGCDNVSGKLRQKW